MKKNLKNIAGVTLVELMVGVAVTALMMGAMFASYSVVNNSYRQVSDKAQISRSGRDIIGMMVKDIRMAGYRYYHGENSEGISFASDLTHISGLEDEFDMIDSHDPLLVFRDILGYEAADQPPNDLDPDTDTFDPRMKHNNSDLCCDRIHIVYEDFDKTDPTQKFKKFRVSYFALAMEDSANDKYYGVYKTKESWIQDTTPDSGDKGNWVSNCSECYTNELVRSHVVDMEFLLFDEHGHHLWDDFVGSYPLPINSTRDKIYEIRQVDMALTFRSNKDFYKSELAGTKRRYVKTLGSDRNKTNPGYKDKYLRESIVVSVHTRNIGG